MVNIVWASGIFGVSMPLSTAYALTLLHVRKDQALLLNSLLLYPNFELTLIHTSKSLDNTFLLLSRIGGCGVEDDYHYSGKGLNISLYVPGLAICWPEGRTESLWASWCAHSKQKTLFIISASLKTWWLTTCPSVNELPRLVGTNRQIVFKEPS